MNFRCGYFYKFAGATVTRSPKLDASNSSNLLSHDSGSQKSKINVCAGLVSSEGCEQEFVLGLSPIFGVPGLTEASPHLCLHLHMPSPCMHVCVQISPCL